MAEPSSSKISKDSKTLPSAGKENHLKDFGKFNRIQLIELKERQQHILENK